MGYDVDDEHNVYMRVREMNEGMGKTVLYLTQL